MNYSKILGTGSYLPERIISNDELSQSLDTSDEWIRTRTGIEQRHIAAPNESSTDMGEQAALRALESAGISAQDLDLIIVATSTPEHLFPSNATQLQSRLGCKNIPAFDIQAVCSGFIYALTVADNFIKAGTYRHILVVGSELFTNALNWQDRSTAILFGDGAGAAVLGASDTPGIYGSILHSDGGFKELLWAPCGPGSSANDYAVRSRFIEMQGREVFKVAVRSLSGLVGELLEKCNMCAEEIDYLVPHQANLRIISATAEHLGMSMDKVIVTVNQHANTSAASVPLALDYGIRSGKIQRGQKLLLEAFGGGFTWGGCILTY
ncbi:beta-ketoacyl-ACP synthase III [Suttonella ornithocola]|uniref:Beta-ketoacyl-[acyl-carrier-protein] synthase III n=1 Tax=Suttonella ornithocola TaxID=279832 RepID=A0A380N0C7_9GAMM|nr:beta-ketoacyl-ACP synthase III [Suttonella ornithocola]SUO97944.1 3-oxoacyl-[acyl-carrier-protein] synthase 3 [Suttonella ornithocola]